MGPWAPLDAFWCYFGLAAIFARTLPCKIAIELFSADGTFKAFCNHGPCSSTFKNASALDAMSDEGVALLMERFVTASPEARFEEGLCTSRRQGESGGLAANLARTLPCKIAT